MQQASVFLIDETTVKVVIEDINSEEVVDSSVHSFKSPQKASKSLKVSESNVKDFNDGICKKNTKASQLIAKEV